MQYFGSNIVEGIAERWVEAGMSWVEVDGAGLRWVHSLVIPSIKSINPIQKYQHIIESCASILKIFVVCFYY